jgi:hypothetical protein
MKKQALVIGINYEGTQSELQGCINDALGVVEVLEEKGYTVKLLTDHTPEKPTRRTILREFFNLINSDASTLYFHYSGHGSSIKDTNGDEVDGKDEVLCPIDYAENGFISDDEMRMLLQFLRVDQTLFAVSDSCCSGTVFDLGFNVKENVVWHGIGKSSKVITMEESRKNTPTKGQCILLSGCRDDQTSADTKEDGKYQGAMTFAFMKALADPKVKTFRDLLGFVRSILKEHGYTQVPMLSSGKKLDLSNDFHI